MSHFLKKNIQTLFLRIFKEALEQKEQFAVRRRKSLRVS